MFEEIHAKDAIVEILSTIQDTQTQKANWPVFITGAGISISAGIPLWQHVKKDLYKDLFDIDAPELIEKQLLTKFVDKSWLSKNVLIREEEDIADDIISFVQKEKQLPPELMLSFYRTKYGLIELQNFLERHYSDYKVSLSYISLEKMMELEFLKYYITLNQDGVFEKCLAKRFPTTRWLSLVTKQDFISFLKESEKEETELKFMDKGRTVIANLHGVYHKPDTLQINPGLLVNPLPRENPVHKFLKKVVGPTNILIVIGYRGADADIRGVLEELLANKKDFSIIWISPGRPPNIFESTTFVGIKKRFVKSTADEFLCNFVLEATHNVIRNNHTLTNLVPSVKPSLSGLVCSAPGSLIIAGDYGVYINGKMIQVQIPLRAYAKRLLSQNEGDKAVYYDPYLGTWEKDSRGLNHIAKARNLLKSTIDGNLERDIEKVRGKAVKDEEQPKIFPIGIPESLRDTFDWLKKRLKTNYNTQIENMSIHACSQFPTESGAGDTLPYVIIAAMILQREEVEVELEKLDNETKRILVTLSKLWTWLYTYPNASHLRILSTFCDKGPVFLLDRSLEQANAFKQLGPEVNRDNKHMNSTAFMKANLMIDTYVILNGAKQLILEDTSLNFAVAYYPRRIILARDILPKTDTRLGVFEINYDRDELLLRVMANYTEEVQRIYENKDGRYDKATQPNRIGKIMSACHFGLVSLGRGTRLVNTLAGALSSLRGIYGAKTSGGGPGGALLIAYNPSEIIYSALESVVEQYQHKILCYMRPHPKINGT